MLYWHLYSMIGKPSWAHILPRVETKAHILPRVETKATLLSPKGNGLKKLDMPSHFTLIFTIIPLSLIITQKFTIHQVDCLLVDVAYKQPMNLWLYHTVTWATVSARNEPKLLWCLSWVVSDMFQEHENKQLAGMVNCAMHFPYPFRAGITSVSPEEWYKTTR